LSPAALGLGHGPLRARVGHQRVGGAVEEQWLAHRPGAGDTVMAQPESDCTACTADENLWWSPGPGFAALYPTLSAVIAPADEPTDRDARGVDPPLLRTRTEEAHRRLRVLHRLADADEARAAATGDTSGLREPVVDRDADVTLERELGRLVDELG